MIKCSAAPLAALQVCSQTQSQLEVDPFARRKPCAWCRLVQAYNQAAATLNLLRGFSTGGYAGLQRVTQWNLDFMDKSDEGQAYLELAKRVDEAIQFMNACGLNAETPLMRETEFYVSHEALLLDYEEALTRRDSTTGLWCGRVLRLWCSVSSFRRPLTW